MPSRILRDDRDKEAWAAFVAAQPCPVTVTLTRGAKRSNPQNKTLHLWIGQIAAETGQTQAEAKAEVKLRYGLPIMERDRPDWVEKWQPLYAPLTYAMRLRLFEALPVTSLMTTRQLSEMMDAIQKDYRAQGVHLTDPEALKYQDAFR